MAQKYNLVLDQGSAFDASFGMLDPVTNSTANVANYVGAAQIRRHSTSNTAYDFEVTLANNAIYLHMDSQETEEVGPGRYLYDVVVRNLTSNQAYRVVEGIVTVTPGITRSNT